MRVQLDGYGSPIPEAALPGPDGTTDAPQLVQLENGEVFIPGDYISLGFTHYEVWCVGASGGRGGPIGTVTYLKTRTRPVMTDAEWDYFIELMEIYAAENGTIFTLWDSNTGTERQVTAREYYEHYIPNHNPWYRYTYRDAFLWEQGTPQGGGGGGGGVHVVSGVLADLPAECAAVVGQAGSHAPPGQNQVNGPWSPTPQQLGLVQAYWDPANTRKKELENWMIDFQYDHPVPHQTFYPPAKGGDGGASTFAGNICRASGGVGGSPGGSWINGVFTADAAGGQGGAGNRATVGGGAAGSVTEMNGETGTWTGVMGQGGGGGRGGRAGKSATDGGHGAFSYADTSVYGQKQNSHAWIQTQYTFDPDSGDITEERKITTTNPIMPGGGGGVRAAQKLGFGSYSPGYNPNGLVLVRVFKVA